MFWNWFLLHGDKLLAGLTTTALALQQDGVAIPGAIGTILAAATVLHTTLLPNPGPTAAQVGTPAK